MCDLAHAGAWNQKAGEGQVISTTHWSRAEGGYYDEDVAGVSDFTKLENRLWLEHGLTKNLTFILNGAIQEISYRDVVEKITFEGFDETEIGIQYEFARREGLAASVRTSYVVDGQLDEAAVTVLSPGDMGEIRFLLGQSRDLSGGVIFHDSQFALRSASLQNIDQIHGAITLGYKPTDRWAVMVQGFGAQKFNFNSLTRRTFVGRELIDIEIVRPNTQSQVIGQISAAWQYKPSRYLQVGGRKTIYGRNIVNESGLFIGLWTEY